MTITIFYNHDVHFDKVKPRFGLKYSGFVASQNMIYL